MAVSIIDDAIALLKEKGIDQWQKGYPDRATIISDLERGKGFFLMEGDTHLAYMCIDLGGEPSYDTLKGSWLTDSGYGVVHRLAIRKGYRGKGLGKVSLALAASHMKAEGCRSFRIDTDDANETMKHLLSESGFSYRGTIWFDESVKIAYEKLL